MGPNYWLECYDTIICYDVYHFYDVHCYEVALSRGQGFRDKATYEVPGIGKMFPSQYQINPILTYYGYQ